MSEHFADRLIDAVRQRGAPVCVGLDPVFERLPTEILERCPAEDDRDSAAADAIVEFGCKVISAVAALVPAIKINSAFFERHHARGIEAYDTLVREAKRVGLIVIGDIKRADVGHSTAMYARAHLGSAEPSDVIEATLPDAVTVNPYLGIDGLAPFIQASRVHGRGLFVLVQTSNPSASEVQRLKLADGGTVAERVAELVEGWATGEELVGKSGYSAVGAVVAPHDSQMTIRLRKLMPHCLFLVPGFGAQGRTADEVRHCFKADGTGALINASRSVIYAYEEPKYLQQCGADWVACVSSACRDFVASVRSVLPMFGGDDDGS